MADWANTPAKLTQLKPAGDEIITVPKLYNKWKSIVAIIYESKK